MKIITLTLTTILVLGITLGVAYFTSLIIGISFWLSLKTGVIWIIVMALFNFALKGISAQLKKQYES